MEGMTIRMIKRDNCLQAINAIINKIDLLEEQIDFKLSSKYNQHINEVENKIEHIEIYLAYVEKNTDIYSEHDKHYA